MRTWRVGDPEPEDHPDILDDDSVIWGWEQMIDGTWAWAQKYASHDGNGGFGPLCMDWAEILEEFGPVTEVLS